VVHDCAVDREVLEVVGVDLALEVDEVAGLELGEEDVDVVVVVVEMTDLELGRRRLDCIVVRDLARTGIA
jgi:hypothetical protein